MVMLYRGNAAGQIAFMMVVYIAEGGNTMALTLFLQAGGFQLLAYQIAHCLGAIGIAACAYKLIKLVGELIIQRNGETFQVISLGKKMGTS